MIQWIIDNLLVHYPFSPKLVVGNFQISRQIIICQIMAEKRKAL